MCGGLIEDAFNFTKSIFQEAFDDPFKFITPGFDPILGNPLKGDFMSGDAVITPTGNFTGDVWERMRERAGEDQGYLDRFSNYNSIADQIAPALAGYYGGAALSGANTAAGAGSTLGTSGYSAGGTLTGDLSGMTATGAGWGTGMSGAGAGAGSSGALLSDLSGLTAAEPGVGTSVFGGGGSNFGSLGRMFNDINTFSNSPLGQTLQGGYKLGSGIMDYMSAQDARKAYEDNVDQIQNLYSVESPYAKRARQVMERQDAARGRLSQFGPRETQLAALLADKQAQTLNSPGYLAQLGASKQKSAGLGGLLQGGKQLISGLRGFF